MIRDRPRSPLEIRVVHSLEWNSNYGVRGALTLDALARLVRRNWTTFDSSCWGQDSDDWLSPSTDPSSPIHRQPVPEL
jgi:hypothetical protein